MTSRWLWLSLGVVPLLLTAGCTEGEGGRLAMTFDDVFVSQWYEHRGLFEATGAQVTFFVTAWEARTEDEKEQLASLQAEGHEIACHGLTHEDPAAYAEESSVQQYVADEIEPAIALMQADGFEPHSFSYPWGGRTAELDEALGGHFSVLRQSGRTGDPEGIVHAAYSGAALAAGRVDDGHTERSEVQAAMEAARRQSGTLVLYAHRVLEESEGSFIHPDDLNWLLSEAVAQGLEFVTMQELAAGSH